MSSETIRLRSGSRHQSVHELGKIPRSIIMNLAKCITWHRCKNHNPKITGDEVAEYWAAAIGGYHRNSPDGLDDVIMPDDAEFAWSVKTISKQSADKCRLITGRCQPEFSFEGFKNKDHTVQEVGDKVLSIWNERVSKTRSQHSDLRSLVLIRDDKAAKYRIFEDELYRISEPIQWRENTRGNFEGFDSSNNHRFTWQPHGAQFTMIKTIPRDAISFSVREPGKIDMDMALTAMGYSEDWVSLR